MKLNLIKSVAQQLKKRLKLITYLILLVLTAWLVYFIFQNVYLSVISPRPLKNHEIIAKKQKVNLDLFNSINDKIIEKKNVSKEALTNIRNPFEQKLLTNQNQ